MTQACITCDFVSEMHDIGMLLSEKVYTEFGGGMGDLLRAAAIAYILGSALMMLLGMAGVDHLKRVAVTFLLFVTASAMLADYGILRDWFFGPIENTALRMGLKIMELSQNIALDPKRISGAANQEGVTQVVADVRAVIGGAGKAAATSSLYGMLIHVVEILVWNVFSLAGEMIGGSTTILSFGRVMAGVILLLPFIFVLGIFMAFMVEAIFKILAIALFSPVLVATMPFRFTRSFSSAALRIVLGAAFTIVFASAAMSFTMASVAKHGGQLRAAMEMEEKVATETSAACGGLIDYETGQGANSDCEAAKSKQEEFNASEFSVQHPLYIKLIIVAFASVLLHLQSKALASNLSGANDGAGMPAAVVLAAKTLMGGGALAANRAAFGQGGLRTSIAPAMQGMFGEGGKSVAEHGIVGGAASIVHAFSAGSPADDGSLRRGVPGTGGAGFSAGGGGFSEKQMQELGSVLGQAVQNGMKNYFDANPGGSGGGRTRMG
jgi:hypothetical protein